MNLLRRHGWGFAARLMTLALVPASLMLIAVNVWLYVVARDEVNADIRERGRLVAAALSEGSQYGVISGNVAAVERTVRGLMAADRSIASIHVLDARREPIVVVEAAPATRNAQVFEVPVGAGALDVNLFDTTGQPHVAFERPTSSTTRSGQPAGYVRVIMSPAPLLEAKRERLYSGSAMVLLAALVSAGVGLALAKRMREPLNAVMAALRSIRQGRYDVHLDMPATGELAELQATIVEMAQGLDVNHQRLEDLVAVRTRQLQEAVESARTADADKRRLIAHGNALVEEERRRISLEIHDDLNASLISIRLEAGALAARAGSEDRPEIRQAAERIAAVTDELYLRARNIVKQLRPEIIDTLGLSGAIEEMVRHFDEIHPECRFEFSAHSALPPIPEQPAIAAYRIVQEALSNVVKHANASHCKVTLGPLPAHDGIQVTIKDDGGGFDPANVGTAGIGIIGMRERVSAIGGSIVIESGAGRGTTVTILLPLPA